MKVRLDRALDLILDRKEDLVLCERGVVTSNWGGQKYDRLTVRGTISIRNPRAVSVVVRGRKSVVGEATIASAKARISITPAPFRGINGRSMIDWEIEIAPGATETLTYTYLLVTDL